MSHSIDAFPAGPGRHNARSTAVNRSTIGAFAVGAARGWVLRLEDPVTDRFALVDLFHRRADAKEKRGKPLLNPTNAELAKAWGVSRRTVQRRLSRLNEKGRIDRRYGGGQAMRRIIYLHSHGDVPAWDLQAERTRKDGTTEIVDCFGSLRMTDRAIARHKKRDTSDTLNPDHSTYTKEDPLGDFRKSPRRIPEEESKHLTPRDERSAAGATNQAAPPSGVPEESTAPAVVDALIPISALVDNAATKTLEAARQALRPLVPLRPAPPAAPPRGGKSGLKVNEVGGWGRGGSSRRQSSQVWRSSPLLWAAAWAIWRTAIDLVRGVSLLDRSLGQPRAMALLLADALGDAAQNEEEARRSFAWGVYRFLHDHRARGGLPSLWEVRHFRQGYGVPPADFAAPQGPDDYAGWTLVPVVPVVPVVPSVPTISGARKGGARTLPEVRPEKHFAVSISRARPNPMHGDPLPLEPAGPRPERRSNLDLARQILRQRERAHSLGLISAVLVEKQRSVVERLKLLTRRSHDTETVK